MNRSVWAEMIDDRKFYHAINSEPDAARDRPGRVRPAAGGPTAGGPSDPTRRSSMDRDQPYTGEHTPLIRLAGAEPRGIQQAGLVLRKSKSLLGPSRAAGRPGRESRRQPGLGAGHRATVRPFRFRGLKTTYATFPLRFTAGGDTDQGRIEIAGTGTGSFHVGAVSLMPADNVRGFRPEVIALLKQLRSGMYRFPGRQFPLRA